MSEGKPAHPRHYSPSLLNALEALYGCRLSGAGERVPWTAIAAAAPTQSFAPLPQSARWSAGDTERKSLL